MPINPVFSASADIHSTRTAMGKRLGEIIADIIGDDRIKVLMDAGGHAEAGYAGKPTGQIALEKGVITPGTKTALLVAQAAERAYTLAEKAEAVAGAYEQNRGNRNTVPTGDLVSYDDPVFKFVGSERDPEILQRAQGTWMAAQMLLNNEIEATNAAIASPDYLGAARIQGAGAAQGFKKTAADLYATAGDMLAVEGHAAAAKKLKAVSQALAVTAKDGPDPSSVMSDLAFDFRRVSQDMSIILSDDRYLDKQPVEDVFKKLERLTRAPGTASAPSLKTAAPGGPK